MSRRLHFAPIYLRKKTPSFHLIGGFAGPTCPTDHSQKNIFFCLIKEIEPRFLGRQVHNQVTTAYRLSYLAPFTVLKPCAEFYKLGRKTSKEHEDIYSSWLPNKMFYLGQNFYRGVKYMTRISYLLLYYYALVVHNTDSSIQTEAASTFDC